MLRLLIPLLVLALTLPGPAWASDGAEPEATEAASEAKAEPPILRCATGSDPCVRPHPARIALAAAGAGTMAAGAALIFALGDRARVGDPSYLMFAGGLMTSLGALAGTLFSIPGNESAVVGHRSRPLFTFGLEPAGSEGFDEPAPPILILNAEPTLQLDRAGTTLGLLLSVGVQAQRETRFDHRWALPIESLADTWAPSSRESRVDLSPRLALPLPYPLVPGPKAGLTGPVEVLWEPALRLRRYDLLDLDGGSRTLQRTSLMPLNFGIRWRLSPRQRFELVAGPRWDLQRLQAGGEELALGRPQENNFYGEVWYVVDVPFAPPGPGAVQVTGRLELGYTQWKGDGRSLNMGSVVGYLGPVHLRWSMQVRAASSPLAAQLRVGAIVADGGGLWFEFGLLHDPLPLGGARSGS